jgi:DNA repair exonuclease SbcCD ATPase subunit
MNNYKNYDYNQEIDFIYHISDIHIHLQSKHDEYLSVFENLYNYLIEEEKKHSNCVIVITGDILHSKTELTPECVEITRVFFNKLSSIFTLLFIAGNHDVNLSNSERLDSLTPIYNGLDNKDNCYYLKDTGLYHFNNIIFSVSSIRDYEIINPEIIKKNKYYTKDTKLICLFHGRVDGVILFNNTTLEGEVNQRTNKTITPSSFNGYDLALLGDIHKRQYLNQNKTVAYAGSLIQQNHGESLDNHGLIKWDILNNKSAFVDIKNNFGYVTTEVENDNINNINLLSNSNKFPKNIHLRITFTKCKNSVINKLLVKIKEKYNVIDVVYLNNTVENNSIEKKNITDFINNIDYQNKILDEILTEKFKLDDNKKTMIKRLNITANEKIIDNRTKNSKWKLKQLEFSNLFSYSSNNIINFSNYNGVVGIIAPNHVGKSAIVDIILYTIYDKFSRKGTIKDIINNTKMTFRSKITIEMDDYMYTIEKYGTLSATKKVNLKINFLRQKINTNIIEKLNEDGIVKTRDNISKYFGNYDDIVQTNVSIQNNNLNFIDCENSNRLKELERILNIDFIQLLEKQARKMYHEKRVIVDHLVKKCDPDKIVLLKKENKSLINNIKFSIEKIDSLKEEIKEINENNLELQNEYIPNIENDIHELETKNSSLVIEDKQELKEKYNNYKNQIDTSELNTLLDTNIFCMGKLKSINDEYEEQFNNEQKKIRKNITILDNNINSSNSKYVEINKIINNLNYSISYENDSNYKLIEKNILEKIHTLELSLKNNTEEINKNKITHSKVKQYIKKYKNIDNEINDINDKINKFSKEELPSNLIDIIENTSPYELEDDLVNLKKYLGINIDKIKKLEENDIANENNTIVTDVLDVCKNNNIFKFLEDYHDKFEINQQEFLSLSKKIIKLKEISNKLKNVYQEDVKLTSIINTKINDNKILNDDIITLKNDLLQIKTNLDIKRDIKVLEEQKNKLLNYKNKEYDIFLKDKQIYIEICDINNKLLLIKNQSQNKKEVIDKLNKLKKQLKNNERINNLLNENNDKLSELNHELKEFENNKLKFDMKYVANNTILQNVKSDVQELQKYEKQMELFNYYQLALKDLPYFIIKKIIPLFEKKINDLLSIMTDFMVKVEIDDNKINMYLDRPIYNGFPILLNNCSGFEKFISSLAIRLSLLDISHLPKPNFLIIDEGWSAFDSKNINNIGSIFDFITSRFNFMLNVSHIQNIRGFCNHQIKLEKRDDGYSYIISS